MQQKTQCNSRLRSRHASHCWRGPEMPIVAQTITCFRVASTNRPVCLRQYARIVGGWVREFGLDSSAYGTHTMRRTKASLIYRRTKNLRVVQLLLGHTNWRALCGTWVSRPTLWGSQSELRCVGFTDEDRASVFEHVRLMVTKRTSPCDGRENRLRVGWPETAMSASGRSRPPRCALCSRASRSRCQPGG
jgi:hypothetical protein